MEGRPMNNLIGINNVSMKHAERTVLKDVTVNIQQGEFFVVIGPNGAGKTTLLNCLSGLYEFEGDISLRQKPIREYPKKELAKSLAMVPQAINADFPFTVTETVLMGRYPHLGLLAVEGRKDLEVARQAMEFTEVSHLADRRLGQLSGGERQRVIIARAICQQPDVLLLDEPTASLDPAHQLRIMDLMERFRRMEKVTVVMVSHDLNLAATYADRLMLLKDGEVIKVGSPVEVLNQQQLSHSYGCNLMVDENPLLKTPRISLISEKGASSDLKGLGK
jgi:iron complex transport system ATP-binding protein